MDGWLSFEGPRKGFFTLWWVCEGLEVHSLQCSVVFKPIQFSLDGALGVSWAIIAVSWLEYALKYSDQDLNNIHDKILIFLFDTGDLRPATSFFTRYTESSRELSEQTHKRSSTEWARGDSLGNVTSSVSLSPEGNMSDLCGGITISDLTICWSFQQQLVYKASRTK